MKTRRAKKLHLSRETLRTLEPQALAGVQGADIGVVIVATIKVVVDVVTRTIQSEICETQSCYCHTCPPCP